MNRCTLLDEILREHLPQQPLEPYWISRPHGFLCFIMCAWYCSYLL